MKLLTVTVPCYNSQDYMANCIESLLKGGERVEIVIIDDGSKDDTGKIADEYAEKYPSIIKVVHQENGGHGEGINSGLKVATGKYFKVVDSDDALADCFVEFLDRLEKIDAENGYVDMVQTNYHYVHSDGKGDKSIVYKNVFKKEDTVLSWDDTHKFGIVQYLTIHSSTFRTDLMRESGLVLPKKVFYEDNLYVCYLLPYCKKLCYFNLDLYLYTIGREGQSVAKEVFTKCYNHQIIVSTLLFQSFDLEKIKGESKKLFKLLLHEMFMMYGAASSYARLNGSDEAEANRLKMWDDAIAHDKKYGKKLRHGPLGVINMKGKFGRGVSNFFYNFAHTVLRFN